MLHFINEPRNGQRSIHEASENLDYMTVLGRHFDGLGRGLLNGDTFVQVAYLSL
jgi:hypothetical protein